MSYTQAFYFKAIILVSVEVVKQEDNNSFHSYTSQRKEQGDICTACDL